MDQTQEKLDGLKRILKDLGHVAVAYSSGVDSTFLLKTAHDVLGPKAVALTACGGLFPVREFAEATAFCRERQIEQIVIEVDERAVEGLCENPKNRCYLCKKDLFGRFLATAKERGIPYLLEGTNADDRNDYRPGMKAVRELGVRSPLLEAGLTKAEIRALSREEGLPTWDKPSFACLASRIPYGEPITREKLSRVEQAEQLLLDRGFRQVRVRMHGDIARIEIEPAEFGRIMEPETLKAVRHSLHTLGFAYVSLDLDGYRTGSLNRTL